MTQSWATPEQLEWLRAQKDRFLKARETGTLETWYTTMYQAWFDRYPESEPSSEEVKAAGGDASKAAETRRAGREKVSRSLL